MPFELPHHPRLFSVKSVNHDWLFPRCKGAIIHGGVGTTAAALRAGLPLIIVSIIADQPWWGRIIEQRALGTHIPFKKLTTQKLLTALEKIESLSVKTQAVGLAGYIQREDGLNKTIEALECLPDLVFYDQ